MLFLFLVLITLTGAWGKDECDYLIVLNKGEVKELRNPNYPFMDIPRKRCIWNFIAEEDRRIAIVCPFNEGSDQRYDKKSWCGAHMYVVSHTANPILPPEDRIQKNCRDGTFGMIGLNNRMEVIYSNDENLYYNRTAGFKCYVYGVSESRWDPINTQQKKNIEGFNPSPECDFHIKLEKNEMVRLVTGKYSGEGWQKCRWRATAPIGSEISLTCPFTDKPPEPLTAQVVPCESEFEVTTYTDVKTFNCSQKSFSITSSKHVISLQYKTNVKVPYEQFECYFAVKSPRIDTSESTTSPLPYENCDEYMKINQTHALQSPIYPEEIKPGTACRWTVEAPENFRLALDCLSAKKPREVEDETLDCLGEFHVELADRQIVQHCQNKGFYEFSGMNWMTVTYNNPSSDPAEAFRCYVWVKVMKPESQCLQCPACCEKCDKLIKLSKGEVRQLLSPNHPAKEPAGSSCRWTVVADKNRRIVLVCPFYHTLNVHQHEQSCQGKFTISSGGGNQTYHCQDAGFSEIAVSNRMLITYENTLNEPADSFSCYVYAEWKSRWDAPENYTWPEQEHTNRLLRFYQDEVKINLKANDMNTLIPPSDLENENGISKRRWAVFAPHSSRISVVCHFTDKPPEPLTIQVVPCYGQFTIFTEEANTTFHCSEGAFSHTLYNNATFIVQYDNRKGRPDNFVCHVYSESDRPRKNAQRPYQNCDQVFNLTGREVGILKSPNYPNPSPPGAECRYSVVVPPESKISIKCFTVPNSETKECLDHFTLVSAGKVEKINCFNETFTRSNLVNFLSVRYDYPKGNLSSDAVVPPFLCRAALATNDEECDDCRITGNFKNLYCDRIIYLGRDEGNMLPSPNHPNNEPGFSTCRWTVVAPPECRIDLSCTHPDANEENVPPDSCNGIITVSTEDRNQTTHCSDGDFSRMSINNRMTFVYTNNHGWPVKPFTCRLFADEKPPTDPDFILKSTLPFSGCDEIFRMNNQEYRELKLPDKDTPGTACRWTVIGQRDSRILFHCPNNNATEKGSCNSQFTVLTPFSETHYCRNENIEKFSINDWMTITYKNPSLNTLEPVKCYVYTEKKLPEPLSHVLSVVETLDYQSCDSHIILNAVGEKKELASPNYPSEIKPGMPCRWTVNSIDLTFISLSCPDLSLDDEQGDTCKGYFTIYPSGSFGKPTIHCRHAPFLTSSTGNQMIITYSNQLGLTKKPFKCSVSAVNSNCRHLINLPLGPYNSFYTLFTPFWNSEVPPWPSCYWYIESPENTQIYLICNKQTTTSGTFIETSLTGDEDFVDGSIRSLDTSFTAISVSNKMTIFYNITETTIPESKIGCWLFVEKSPPLGEECNCGNKFNKTSGNLNRRIYNGVETLPNEYPMMAGLCVELQVICGATIISDRYALTAAHCLSAAKRKGVMPELLVGAHRLDSGYAISGKILKIDVTIPHPLFNFSVPSFLKYDIAIVGVESPMEFDNKVSPVCLPFSNRDRPSFYDEKVVTLGWGLTRERGTFDWFNSLQSDVLLQIEQNVETNIRCQKKDLAYRYGQHLCTQYTNKTACGGDSGSPVLWKDPQTGLWKLLAVHIGGTKCGDADVRKMVSLNTKVTFFLDWIEEALPNVKFCKVE